MIKEALQNGTIKPHQAGQPGLERPYNSGAMKKAIIRSTSNVLIKGTGENVSERPDNCDDGKIKPMKDTTTNKTAPKTTEEAPKRSKANYDIVTGKLLGHIKSNEGVHLNGLCDIFGTTMSDKKTPNPKGLWAFPVIYAGVAKLKASGAIHATGAKKNQGLYLTAEAAKKNTPEPTVRTPRKKDAPFVLEKQTKKGTWRASEGGTDRKPIMDAFDIASSVPGSTYRVMDNTGKEPKMLKSNEEPTKAAPAKAAKAAKTEPAKAVKA